MTYALVINDNSPIWIDGALFFVISLVAGREQNTAALSVGGRALTGISKTWMSAALSVGDQLSILHRDSDSVFSNPFVSSATQGGEPPHKRIAGLSLSHEQAETQFVRISEHDLVQAVGTWDATTDVFKLSLNALTSSEEGGVDGGDEVILEQPSDAFRAICIRIF